MKLLLFALKPAEVYINDSIVCNLLLSLCMQVILFDHASLRAIAAHLAPPSRAVRLGTGPPASNGASWRNLLFSERRADVHFTVGGETIPAHVVILETKSDYFRIMFAASMAEANGGVVQVEGHSPAAFRALLSFLYTDEVRVEPELLPAVLMVAGQYLATELHGAALRMALRCLGTHNAMAWLITAHMNLEHLAELKAPSLKFVVEHYDECMRVCSEGGDPGEELLLAHPDLHLEVTQGFVVEHTELRKRLRESVLQRNELRQRLRGSV